MAWEFYCEPVPRWRGLRLDIANRHGDVIQCVTGMEFETVQLGELIPTYLDDTKLPVPPSEVIPFLQAAMDCAYGLGLRPKGYEDQKGELSAVRYHLEDMRQIALGSSSGFHKYLEATRKDKAP